MFSGIQDLIECCPERTWERAAEKETTTRTGPLQ